MSTGEPVENVLARLQEQTETINELQAARRHDLLLARDLGATLAQIAKAAGMTSGGAGNTIKYLREHRED